MADEIKDTNKDGAVGDGAQVQQDPTRSEKRFTDLTNKLTEQERKHALELEERDKALKAKEDEAKALKFEAEMLKQTSKYPQATEYQTEIKSYTEKGLSVEEATTLVLGKNNRLQTQEDQTRSSVDSLSMGGSSINANPGTKDPSKMTQEERRAELQKMEDKGDFGVKDGALFMKE